MPTRPVLVDVQQGFAGGLNITADESQVQPNQFVTGTNARLSIFGAVQKRRGVRKMVASALAAASVLGGYTWERAAAIPQLLFVCNGHLYTAPYASAMTATDRGSGVSTTVTPSFAAFRNGSGERVYIADGGPLNSWDGTTLSLNISGSSSVQRVWVYNSRLFGITGSSETLYWSDLNNGDTLGDASNGGGQAKVGTFGDQSLTMGAPLSGVNILLHVTGISVFEGWTIDDINISSGTRGLGSDVGTIAWRGVVQAENSLWVPTSKGIYQVTPSGVVPAGVLVDRAFTALTSGDLLGVIGVHSHATQEIWFYVPSVGVYVYHERLAAWSGPWTVPALTAMWTSLDSDGKPIVLCGDSTGFIKQLDYTGLLRDNVLSDGTGGTAYTFSVRCRRQYCGDPVTTKALNWIYLIGNLQASLVSTVSWVTDEDAGTYIIPNSADPFDSGVWDDGAVWDGTEAVNYDVPAGGVGRRIDITLSDASESEVSFSRVETAAYSLGRR